MNWPLTIVAVIIFYYIYQLDKRINNIVEDKGPGHSYTFTIYVREAIAYHSKFIRDSKIKNQDKEYKDWPQEDKNKFSDFMGKHIENKGWVKITYLASENGFFIRDSQGKSDFQFRDSGSKNIFGEKILGDEDKIFSEGLDFQLFVNIEKCPDGKYRDFIIGCLKERFEGLSKSPKIDILFKFPYNSMDLKDEDYEALGFKIKREGGDDVFENSLGVMETAQFAETFEKNKTEIQILT